MASTVTAAHCLRCDWAETGDPAAVDKAVDKAAEKHTTKPPNHPTATVTRPASVGRLPEGTPR